MATERQPLLLGLVGVIVALLAWTLADSLAEERKPVDQRKLTTERLLARGAHNEGQPDGAQANAKARREALTRRLSVSEDQQVAKARLYYELREHCAAAGLNCTIRLGESTATTASPPTSALENADGLERLGVQRLRARLSGSVGDHDIVDLLHRLTNDPAVQWRINRLQMRGRGFELDVERHLVFAGN